jgi:hypothetical protein
MKETVESKEMRVEGYGILRNNRLSNSGLKVEVPLSEPDGN